MPERPATPFRRPLGMRIDDGVCIHCGACDDIAPGMRERAARITVTSASLEAMAACPVGAILWLEGETHEQDA